MAPGASHETDPEMHLYSVYCPQSLNNLPFGLLVSHCERLLDATGGRTPVDEIGGMRILASTGEGDRHAFKRPKASQSPFPGA